MCVNRPVLAGRFFFEGIKDIVGGLGPETDAFNWRLSQLLLVTFSPLSLNRNRKKP